MWKVCRFGAAGMFAVGALAYADADTVEATNAPHDDLIVMLDIRAKSGGGSACRNDVLRQGVGGVNVGTNALLLGACHGAVAILSANHALAYVNDPAALPWTNEQGDVARIALADTPLRVPIAFIVRGGTPDIATALNVQLAKAATLLRDSFSGLELAGDEAGGAIPKPLEASPPQAQAIGNGCGSVAAIKADPVIYQRGRLNVYVVSPVNGVDGGTAAGASCFAEGASDIIFLDVTASLDFTLMHEIGHALGLVRPTWGHTDGLRGFREAATDEPLNVMAGAKELSPLYFSVSQVVRMTMATESWLNQPSASSGTTLRQRQSAAGVVPLIVACGCPETVATPDCPALRKDIARPYPFQAVSAEVYACAVSVEATVDVGCSKTVKVTAKLLQGARPAVGSGKWVSLNPEIVTAATSEDSTTEGVITGVAEGVGTVRVWGDGSSSTMTVKVGKCS